MAADFFRGAIAPKSAPVNAAYPKWAASARFWTSRSDNWRLTPAFTASASTISRGGSGRGGSPGRCACMYSQ
jgi:hypothetical protein